ncbi:MAG: nucleotidyltransferase family protein [Clostridiales bacterium]|nr:nucleotidyltransferase family protein [Clostridiales bacterium]
MSAKNSKTTPDEQRAATYDLIYLTGCAVNGVTPALERVERMDLALVHAISHSHSLAAISCMALEDAYGGKLPETEPVQKWVEEKNQAIYKTLLFDVEREQVLTFLEENGIWYLPLKGILMKDLYPKLGMRQMADNDILFDAAYQTQVHDWFIARGYEAESYQTGNHDAYHKKPVYNFELHTALFGAMHDPVWQAYYHNVKDRLLPQAGTKYGYRFSDEDCYIYITTHACKHHSGGGTGLRTLLDCYVYNQAKGDTLNRGYIQEELGKLGIAEFEEALRGLSQKLFAQPEQFSPASLSEGALELLFGFASSGTYGTIQNTVRNQLKGLAQDGQTITAQTKLRYIWKRLFPDVAFFREYYPFFYRHKWLLPVGYVYRLIYKGITNHKKLSVEADSLKKL